MLALLRSLRPARLLAILAILVMVGLGQHVHAAEPPASGATALAAGQAGDGGDSGGKPLPATHCALCHLGRGTVPEAETVAAPVALRSIPARPAGHLQPDLAVPEGPARPPRSLRAA